MHDLCPLLPSPPLQSCHSQWSDVHPSWFGDSRDDPAAEEEDRGGDGTRVRGKEGGREKVREGGMEGGRKGRKEGERRGVKREWDSSLVPR